MFGPGLAAFASVAFVFALYQDWLPYSNEANVLVKLVLAAISLVIFGYTFIESKLSLWHRVTGLKSAWAPVYVSRLGFSDTAVLIFLIIFKYLWKTLGLLPAYKPAPDGRHILLPELSLSSSIKIDESDYVRYDAAISANLKSQSSTSSPAQTTGQVQDRIRPLLLPALTTPMMLVLVANRHLPVLPFGSVNTSNRFEFVDPAACRDPLDTLALGTQAVVSARVGGAGSLGRRVKRGVEFDVTVELKCARKDEPQGGSRVVFRQIITILAFLPKSAKPVWDEAVAVKQDGEDGEMSWAKEPNAAVGFGLGAPGRWAAVCADYNPIHMSVWMARMFGFKSRIAHGNHVVASVIEELQTGKNAGVAERGLKNLLVSKQPSFLEVQFKRPMTLPTDLVVRYGSSKDLGTYTFSVEKADKTHVTGRAGLLRQ